MPSRCCVPGCKNNYDKKRKSIGNVSVFLFPKEAERRDLWLKHINRKNFVVTQHSAVCIDHFEEKFIIREDRVTRPDGSVLALPRKRLKLSCDAFPSNFPNQPKYSSAKLPPNRMDPTERAAAIELVEKDEQKQREAILKAKNNLLKEDLRMNFDHQSGLVKQEVQVKDEIDNEALTYCDRIKIENGLMVEKTEPKIETRQDIEDFDSDATTNSDVVLERMLHEQMENQSKHAKTIELDEVVKIQGDDASVKIKIEKVEKDTIMGSVRIGDESIKQLVSDEFEITNKDIAVSCDVPERILNEQVKMENRSEYGGRINEIVKIERGEEEVKVKVETIEADANMNSGQFEGESIQQLSEKFEIKYEVDASSHEVLESGSEEKLLRGNHLTTDPCANHFEEAETSDGREVVNRSESAYPFFDSQFKQDAYSESLSFECVDVKRETELFHTYSIYDSETNLENRKNTQGDLGSSNAYVCTQCHVSYKTQLMLDEHVIENHPNLIASIFSEIYECSTCTYKTTISAKMTTHLQGNCMTSSRYKSVCMYCNATFIRNRTRDDHILREHPNFIESVTSKIHECKICTYKTTVKTSLAKHMPTHFKNVASYKHECAHCSGYFLSKLSLDDHILKLHPNSISSVSSRIHECKKCTFKTAIKGSFNEHMVRNHPDSIADIPLKLLECAHCEYKTTNKCYLAKHIPKHLKAVPSYNYKCVHCSGSFLTKLSLNNHILRFHPNFIASVFSKIHECKKCKFKTTIKGKFNEHMVRKHPDSIADNSLTILECAYCIFKTTYKCYLAQHIQKHFKTIRKL